MMKAYLSVEGGRLGSRWVPCLGGRQPIGWLGVSRRRRALLDSIHSLALKNENKEEENN